MEMTKYLMPALLAAVVSSGCAWVPQTAKLQLTPEITPSTVGQGVTVAVRVTDRRTSQTIGRRGVDSEDAAITTTQNVITLFQDKIVQGLEKKGFTAGRYDGQPVRTLTVEIRRIDYKTDMEFWKGIVKTEAVLDAVVLKDDMKFEQTYTGQRKDTTVEAPSAKTNDRLINGAISEAVQKLFEDHNLLRFLAE